VYRLVETSFPAQEPHLAHTRAAWRRWSQIKVLQRELERIHKNLYLAGSFPPLPVSSFFTRKEEKVIEERRAALQELLEFCAEFPVLYNSQFFQDFFKPDGNLLEADVKSESTISGEGRSPDTQSLMSVSELSINPSQDLGIDRTPTLTPTPVSPSLANQPVSPSLSHQSASSSSQQELTRPSCLPLDPLTKDDSAKPTTLSSVDTMASTPMSASSPITMQDEGVRSYEDGDGGIPAYITEAARIIASALSLEAEEQFEQSITAYRSAIGCLLSSVQGDPDIQRRAAVKKRVAQYISKAEQLVQRELETRTRKESRKVSGIPHLQLFGQLSELREYRVVDIFDKKIILAENLKTKQQVIFKVLQKSAAVYKKSKTSLLPINITYMVGLVKYFETDDAVYLMLEYCPAGKLWDVVQPLVHQQLYLQELEQDATLADSKPVPGVLKPSESFVLQRQASYAAELEEEDADTETTADTEDTESDVEDISFVHTHSSSSLLVISGQQIDHYQCDKDEEEDEEGYLNTSREMLKDLNDQTTLSTAREEDMMSRLTGLEERIRGHLQGNLDNRVAPPSQSLQDFNNFNDETETRTTSRNIKEETTNSEITDNDIQSANSNRNVAVVSAPTDVTERKISFRDNSQSDQEDTECTDRPAVRPKLLRKLSEVLPQCPDPDLQDSTFLPDRVVRLWAAELAQVLSSLHYREIIIKDLNPTNVLLDSSGHLKLTYQCEWVSIERELSSVAIEGRFVSPEVSTVSEITPAADWWSYGAILLLLYTGKGPSSLIPTGLDSSIPLSFPPSIPADCQSFISSLLEVYPVNRLGAGSTGSLDIRNHPYFKAFDWTKMAFCD